MFLLRYFPQLMVYFQTLVLIPSGYLELFVFDKLFGFIGCLLLNSLTFVTYHLWVIGRRFKVMFLFPLNPRFDPFIHLEWLVFGKLSRLIGYLSLDPMMFVSYHLWTIGR